MAGLQQRRHRWATETTEVREARLVKLSSCQSVILVAETDEEREARLQWMRDRLAAETDEERQARLQQMSAMRHWALRQVRRERPDCGG